MKILHAVRERGTAVVMVTHNLNLLDQFPGVVYECADGTLHEVTDKYNQAMEVSLL